MDDYYKTLGLKRGANLKEISAAYRAQSLIYHPDKRRHHGNSENSEHFHKIKAAYQALQDPKLRAELDLQLIAQEERVKRNELMSEQRKKLRDDLLSREAGLNNYSTTSTTSSSASTTKRPTTYSAVSNPNSSLILKYRTASASPDIVEMIKASLGFGLLQMHAQTPGEVVAEFKSPQEAYEALCKLPNDMVTRADWFNGYPPDNLNVSFPATTTKRQAQPPSENENTKASFSKELENSVLEKLLQKKKLKQQQQANSD
jgi:curved DNA-binding protein CbpA